MFRHLTTKLLAVTLCLATPSFAEIEVSSLQEIRSDAVGLISPLTAGLPSDFWADVPIKDITALFERNQNHQLPVLRDLMYRIALAELTPPEGGADDARFFTARLSFLLQNGALDQLEALLEKSNGLTTDSFSYWFAAKLLSQRFDEACTPMIGAPYLAQSIDQTIFCLAQNNRWFDADLTLSSAKALGTISDELALLLDYFLEPEGLEEIAFPPLKPAPKDRIMTFTLARALGLPPPEHIHDLPLRFGELSEEFGWRAQLLAGETLVKSGAISPRLLRSFYAQGVPSASGGLWERVRMWQNLDRAIQARDSNATCAALAPAFDQFAKANLLGELAAITDSNLAQLSLEARCLSQQVSLLLLKQSATSLIFDLPLELPASDPRRQLIEQDRIQITNGDPLLTAMQSVFAIKIAPIQDSVALLEVISHLANPLDATPQQVQSALRQLRANGLTLEAKQLALQILALRESQ